MPARINPIDRIVGGVAVEVDAPAVPQRVACQEPPLLRVVEAVRAEDQPRLRVRVVPRLPPEAEHVGGAGPLLAEAVVQVGREQAAGAAGALGDVAALVEGVEGRAAADVAQDQAPRPEHGLTDDAAAAVEFADGLGAVVEIVRPRPRAVLLPSMRVVMPYLVAGSFLVWCQHYPPAVAVERSVDNGALQMDVFHNFPMLFVENKMVCPAVRHEHYIKA